VTKLLRWRYATKADRRLRQAFTCTDPPRWLWDQRRGKFHPAEWELEVQNWARAHASTSGEFMILGLDQQGIGALSAWVEADRPSDVLLQAIAVAMRYRHQDGSCAKETLSEVVSCIESKARATGADRLLINARIDHRNKSSKRLCAAAGFVYQGDFDEKLETWSYTRKL
jgi:RimJ/RimL family protein N-acetyltransferase